MKKQKKKDCIEFARREATKFVSESSKVSLRPHTC